MPGRRRDDCSICTAFDDDPSAELRDLDVNAAWAARAWWQRAALTVQFRAVDAADRIPGYRWLIERRELRRTRCPYCGEMDQDVFMLHDDVWASLGLPEDAGWFCLQCIEKRLGRPVAQADLCDVPANEWR